MRTSILTASVVDGSRCGLTKDCLLSGDRTVIDGAQNGVDSELVLLAVRVLRVLLAVDREYANYMGIKILRFDDFVTQQVVGVPGVPEVGVDVILERLLCRGALAAGTRRVHGL